MDRRTSPINENQALQQTNKHFWSLLTRRISGDISKLTERKNSDFKTWAQIFEKVSKSSILTKVSILSILAKSIGNLIPLEPAMFLVSIPDQSLNTS
jgi:hypothetical protein